MSYSIVGYLNSDKSYRMAFNGYIMAFCYFNNDIEPDISRIKSDFKNGVFLHDFMPNSESIDSEFRQKMINSIFDAPEPVSDILKDILEVVGFFNL